MAESDSVLEQRVEALEQFSQARVVEEVADLSKRVARIESARETEEPHLATKADIVRLETKLDAQTEFFTARLDEQATHFDAKLDARFEQINARMDAFDMRMDAFDMRMDAFDMRMDAFDTRMDAQATHFDAKLDAQATHFDSKLDAQATHFDSKLDALSEKLQKEIERRMNRQTMWTIGTAIALAALILSRLPG